LASCEKAPEGDKGKAPTGKETPTTQPAGTEEPKAEPKPEEPKAEPKPEEPKAEPKPEEPKAEPAAKGDMVELKIELPAPQFRGTPKNLRSANLPKVLPGPRGAFMVPQGTELLSAKKPVTASDSEPIIGELKQITDGDKEGMDGSWVELGPGLQWVQLDLEKPAEIYAIVIWHSHAEPCVFRDVVVQVADDPDFVQNVRTLFNNDHDNSSGLGIGKEYEWIETRDGQLIDAKGVKARYVRMYSNGSTSSDQNPYTEVEVFGKAAK